jgi:hypothetical protein
MGTDRDRDRDMCRKKILAVSCRRARGDGIVFRKKQKPTPPGILAFWEKMCTIDKRINIFD